jgi:hypothetical protein
MQPSLCNGWHVFLYSELSYARIPRRASMLRAPRGLPTAEALRSQQRPAMGTALPRAMASTRGTLTQPAMGRAPAQLLMAPQGMQAPRLAMTPQAMAGMRLGEARRWVVLLLCGRLDCVFWGLISPTHVGCLPGFDLQSKTGGAAGSRYNISTQG